MNRIITGYLKGNYNDSIDKFETFNGDYNIHPGIILIGILSITVQVFLFH